jgi:hypothetical protein
MTVFIRDHQRSLSWARRIQTHPAHSISKRSILILISHLSSEWSLPSRLSNKDFLCIPHLFHARYMPCPSHPPCFDHSNHFVSVYKLSAPSLRNFIQPHVTSSLSDSNTLLCTLFSNTLNPCSFLNVKVQVSYRGKITVWHILTLVLDSAREDKRFWTDITHIWTYLFLYKE